MNPYLITLGVLGLLAHSATFAAESTTSQTVDLASKSCHPAQFG